MAERWHPEEDLLLAVALGEAPDGGHDDVAEHLTACAPCRRTHAALLDGVDLALPAVPRTAPPPGFETRVLDRLRQAGQPPAPTHRARRWLPAAAAALLGLAAGAAGGGLLVGTPDERPAVSASASPLVDDDGVTVGSVTGAYGDGGRQLVVVVGDDAPATSVTCRVVLADGTVREVGRWPLTAGGERAWVIDREPGVRAVELVDESGKVWATAAL